MDTAILESMKADLSAHLALSKKNDERLGALQSQIDAIDLATKNGRMTGGEAEATTLGQKFTQSNEFKAAAEANFEGNFRKGLIVEIENPFEGRKSVISTFGIGHGTSGVQMPQRLPGVERMPRQNLRIRDLLRQRPVTGGRFDWTKQNVRTNMASPQQETSPKAESTYGWTTQSGRVVTLAHFTQASRQSLADVPWLRGEIDSELLYGLLLKEEAEILAGDGTGEHLNGIIPQSSARATTWDVAGDTRLDRLRWALLQISVATSGAYEADGIVLNPVDMAKLELTKTEEGAANKGVYILGDPRQGTAIKFVWGVPVCESHSIAAGTFLTGAFSTAAELADRQQATIEISFEHSDNFTRNLATILCEERLGLAVRNTNAFVYGSF